MNRTVQTGNMRILWLLLIGVCLQAAPYASAQAEEQHDYVLVEMDVISIQVFGEEDLSKVQRIDGSGNIRMGLIGTVSVAGLTLREAESQLEESFVSGRYLRDPQVSISVEEYAPQYVSVLGQVDKPGRVLLEKEANSMRLVDAISAVGGFTGIAKSDAVRITRMETNGTEQTVNINATSLINGESGDAPAEFIHLQPGDVVFVPERLF